MHLVVATPQLPAGNYVVTARAKVLGVAGGQLLCALGHDAVQATPVNAAAVLPLSMTTATRLAAPGTIDLSCESQVQPHLQIAQATIVATRVATLTGP